jgi:alpha-L-fucosidase
MNIRTCVVSATAALCMFLPALLAADAPSGEKMLEGQFQPSWESLQQYQCPDWFRDAKFGIWAHWSAQCQPEQGDWYAKGMYVQESQRCYKYHVEHYGHPSKVGFKDICNLWKAEEFDPDKLIELYKRAGAKYFVSLANHHCNFDCYDSKYQPWNSVNIGPKKDIVGMWEKAARKNGLRYGISVHAARSWTWYEVAQGSDTTGPMAGVPYDGKLTKADGKGQWWEGLDPQDLYAQNHKPGEKPDKAYCDKFFNRTLDLINKYKPDLLYFDDGGLPLAKSGEDYGLRIAAHYYNSSMQWHNGNNEAVMNTKALKEDKRKCLVMDIERGKADGILPEPWQTDTCLGGWHYVAGLYKRHGYKTPTTVIHLLVDIVSKNGNLLLSVPVKGDGTIDSDEVAILEDIAKWMEPNSEAIFGTRPWKVFGEGFQQAKSASFHLNERKPQVYTSEDIRFTTKGDTLYATAFVWPETGKLTIKTLGKRQTAIKGDISGIQLLGSDAKVEYSREDKGLVVTMPSQKPCEHAWVLKIKGLDLAGSEPKSEMITLPSKDN